MDLAPTPTTDDETPRRGGLSVWAPSITPPLGVDLTDEQALACAFRILAGDGFSENLAGHITWQRPGHSDLLVNPWGLWWEEITASDVCTVDEDAAVVSGRWDVTPAIHIHTELHRRRPDARVVVHNHPYHVSLMAALGVVPELVHQTGSLFLDDICLVEEYSGEVDTATLAVDLAEQIGTANVAILGNHGVIVCGATPALATYRAASIDRACRLAYDVLLTGRTPLRMARSVMVGMQQSLVERAADVHWAGSVRRLVRDQPEVLR
jgi:ribulose-5-phosphate 4-epimerase/fuculose-1-phosphate aldolase